MKKMHKLIEECVERLDTALIKIAKSDNKDVNIRDLMANYTMDVISYCAFATKIDTHNNDAEVHPFVKNAQVFFKPSLRFGLYFLSAAMVPSLVKKFNLTFVSSDVIDYFESTVCS